MSEDLYTLITVLIKVEEFNILAKMKTDKGVFYHKLSKTFEKIYKNTPKFIVFIHPVTKMPIMFRLCKAEKVIKTIGYESNDSFQKIRVGAPMIKLTLAKIL